MTKVKEKDVESGRTQLQLGKLETDLLLFVTKKWKCVKNIINMWPHPKHGCCNNYFLKTGGQTFITGYAQYIQISRRMKWANFLLNYSLFMVYARDISIPNYALCFLCWQQNNNSYKQRPKYDAAKGSSVDRLWGLSLQPRAQSEFCIWTLE